MAWIIMVGECFRNKGGVLAWAAPPHLKTLHFCKLGVNQIVITLLCMLRAGIDLRG